MGNQDCNDGKNYDDIINLPHPVSAVHPPMKLSDRAAQFSAFAALTGFGDAVRETGRLTDRRIELDEDAKELLDEKMRMIQERISDCPKASLTYFCPDEKKEGGFYTTVTGNVRKIDGYGGLVVMADGTKIQLNEIIDIILQK